MSTLVNDRGNEIDLIAADGEINCSKCEFEYKKQFKECLICNKQEKYIDDPMETHVHNFASGLIPDKPKLHVCTLCGQTKYEFDCEDAGDEGFFKFTSDYIDQEDKPVRKVAHLPKFKNKLPKKEIDSFETKQPSNTTNYEPVGKRYLNWRSNNLDKLSFIRR